MTFDFSIFVWSFVFTVIIFRNFFPPHDNKHD